MLKKILVGLAVAILVALIGLHFVLTHRLNMFIQRVAVPAAREKLQVNVSAGEAGIHLFAGTAALPDIRIGNPPGFIEPEVLSVGRTRVKLSMGALLRGRTRIATLKLQDARFTVIRDSTGRLNTHVLLEALRAPPTVPPLTAPAGPPPVAVSSEGGISKPSVCVPLPPPARTIPDRVRMNGTVTYIDHPPSNTPFRVDFEIAIAADGLSGSGDATAPWGTFTIRGHLASNPDMMATDLRGRIAPLSDPAKPSFDLSGEIKSVDPALILPLVEKAGISCDPSTIVVKAICRDGVFDETQSVVTLQLKNVRLSHKKSKHGLMATLSSVTIPLPLGGTIQNPRVQWETALPTALLQSIGNNPASILGSLGVKSNDVDKALRRWGLGSKRKTP